MKKKAPEVLLDHSKISPASDFWQLGILMYEMLYSHTPFASDNDEETFHLILNSRTVFP